MTPRPFRFLGSAPTPADPTSSSSSSSSTTTDQSPSVDSDFVVILAALLCALICVLGLIAVARCAWLRRLSNSRSQAPPPAAPPPAANKGLKKKILRALPKQTVSSESAGKLSDCAICLTEFAAGDEIRILPQCGHGFHVSCIDTWLGSHSSCPSCRQILVVARCQKCGGLPASTSGAVATGESEARLKAQEDRGGNRFLA